MNLNVKYKSNKFCCKRKVATQSRKIFHHLNLFIVLSMSINFLIINCLLFCEEGLLSGMFLSGGRLTTFLDPGVW